MPTLEVQLAKARTSLAALEEVMGIQKKWEVNGWHYYPRQRVDQMHGNDAELRGLRERVRHLQQRLDWELRQNLTSLAARYGADLGAHSAAVVPFLPYRQVDAEAMTAKWLRQEQAAAAHEAARSWLAAAAARSPSPISSDTRSSALPLRSPR
jgi:hypothetical protein